MILIGGTPGWPCQTIHSVDWPGRRFLTIRGSRRYGNRSSPRQHLTCDVLLPTAQYVAVQSSEFYFVVGGLAWWRCSALHAPGLLASHEAPVPAHSGRNSQNVVLSCCVQLRDVGNPVDWPR